MPMRAVQTGSYRRPKRGKLRSQASWLILGIVASLGVVWGLLALPSTALSVKVTPLNPQLGDTIAVMLETKEPSPTLKFGGKTYPMFMVSGNRFQGLLPTTPLDRPGKLSLQVQAGKESQSLTVNLRNRTFPTQSIWLPAGQTGEVSDFEFDRVDAFKQIVSPQKFWKGKLLRPNNGPITTIYGVRRYYNGEFANDYFHRGVDYAGAMGSAIIAPAAGQVRLICREKEGFKVHGNCIGLDHGQGLSSIFLHLNRIDVKDGDFVQAGQKIGTLGNTGASTGPHLHWGLYVHGLSVDPVPWREQGFD